MSLVVRKPAFCICENNGADQLFALLRGVELKSMSRCAKPSTPQNLPSTDSSIFIKVFSTV